MKLVVNICVGVLWVCSVMNAQAQSEAGEQKESSIYKVTLQGGQVYWVSKIEIAEEEIKKVTALHPYVKETMVLCLADRGFSTDLYYLSEIVSLKIDADEPRVKALLKGERDKYNRNFGSSDYYPYRFVTQDGKNDEIRGASLGGASGPWAACSPKDKDEWHPWAVHSLTLTQFGKKALKITLKEATVITGIALVSRQEQEKLLEQERTAYQKLLDANADSSAWEDFIYKYEGSDFAGLLDEARKNHSKAYDRDLERFLAQPDKRRAEMQQKITEYLQKQAELDAQMKQVRAQNAVVVKSVGQKICRETDGTERAVIATSVVGPIYGKPETRKFQITAFTERIEGEKIQLRVAGIRKFDSRGSDLGNTQQLDAAGTTLQVNSIIWDDPMNWSLCR